MSLNIPSTPAQAALHDLTTLKAMGQRVTERCPDLRQMARETASQILRNHVGSDLDPDNVYWHRFVTTESSRRTFNGWQHRGTPIESMTLPQLTLHRFNVQDQIAADELQLMSGFYTAGPQGHVL